MVRHLPCFLGLDVGYADDFTALAALWKGENRYYFRCYLFNPSETIKRRSLEGRVPYREWADAGHIIEVPGATVRDSYVDAKFQELCQQFDVVQVGVDRAYARSLCEKWADEMPEDGVAEVSQGLKSLQTPTRRLLELIVNKEIVHDGNPVLGWMT